MYIISGPSGLHAFMALKASSSFGPSYNISVLYLWAVTGDGKWIAIIHNKQSPAGNHDFMTAFIKGLPPGSIFSLSSGKILMFSFSMSARYSSFLKFMMAETTLKIGSNTNWTKPRL